MPVKKCQAFYIWTNQEAATVKLTLALLGILGRCWLIFLTGDWFCSLLVQPGKLWDISLCYSSTVD